MQIKACQTESMELLKHVCHGLCEEGNYTNANSSTLLVCDHFMSTLNNCTYSDNNQVECFIDKRFRSKAARLGGLRWVQEVSAAKYNVFPHIDTDIRWDDSRLVVPWHGRVRYRRDAVSVGARVL